MDQGVELVKLYVEKFRDLKVRAAEVPFEVPLTGEIILRGYLDLLVEPDTLVEIKTAARRFTPEDLRRKLQLSAYAFAYRQLHHRDPTVTVVSLLKTKKPAIDMQLASRTQEDDAFFVATACEVARGIEARAFPPNPGWLCNDCEYSFHCATFGRAPLATPGAVPQAA